MFAPPRPTRLHRPQTEQLRDAAFYNRSAELAALLALPNKHEFIDSTNKACAGWRTRGVAGCAQP